MTLSLRCCSWTWDFLKFNSWQEWSDQNFPVLLCNICQPKKCAAFLKLPFLPWETLLYLAYPLIPSTLTDFQFKKEKLKKNPSFYLLCFYLSEFTLLFIFIIQIWLLLFFLFKVSHYNHTFFSPFCATRTLTLCKHIYMDICISTVAFRERNLKPC